MDELASDIDKSILEADLEVIDSSILSRNIEKIDDVAQQSKEIELDENPLTPIITNVCLDKHQLTREIDTSLRLDNQNSMKKLKVVTCKKSASNVLQQGEMTNQTFRNGDVSTAAGTTNWVSSWDQINGKVFIEEPNSACTIGPKALLPRKKLLFTKRRDVSKTSGKTLRLQPKKNKLFIKKTNSCSMVTKH